MKITLDNYEAYFLDYMEGNLNAEQLSELSLFLTLHPELKPLLEYSIINTIDSANYNYKNKNLLKKFDFQTIPINDRNFNDFCIAYNEQILTHEKVSELKSFCDQNPGQIQNFELFTKVYLKPQVKLKYPKKKSLYRKVIVHSYIATPIFRIVAAAASIALVITTYYLVSTSKIENIEPQKITMTNKQPIIVKPTKTLTIPIIAEKIERKSSYKKISSNVKVPLPYELMIDTPIYNPALRKDEELYLAQLPSLEIKPLESESNKTSILFEPEIGPEIRNNSQTLSATVGIAIEKFKNEVINLEGIKDKKGNISLMKLVKVGITGINKITESNMILTEKTDSTGNITAYSFNSEIIKFQKNVRN